MNSARPRPEAGVREARRPRRAASVEAGAVPAERLEAEFPPIDLPIAPPYAPMEATAASALPPGEGWWFEPKWDGFRCLAFRSGGEVLLQSKSGQPLTRYFPEVVAALRRAPARRFVLDGELVVVHAGAPSFDVLLQRIHPAESRVRRLAAETPATFILFDLLVNGRGRPLVSEPLTARRKELEKFFRTVARDEAFRLSPITTLHKEASRWINQMARVGLDGIVAKRIDVPYRSGLRDAMVKVKLMRTADCVVGGFRYTEDGRQVASLLLGLYNDRGLLDHVGFTSSFGADERTELGPIVRPLVEAPGFTGRAPGGPSRWSRGRSTEWQPLRPALVCEVRYDHVSGGRFRHGTKFLRWRPDKSPRECTFAQLNQPTDPDAGTALFST